MTSSALTTEILYTHELVGARPTGFGHPRPGSRSKPLAGAMSLVAGVSCVIDQWIDASERASSGRLKHSGPCGPRGALRREVKDKLASKSEMQQGNESICLSNLSNLSMRSGQLLLGYSVKLKLN